MPLKPLRRALLDAIDQPPHRLKLGLHAVATSRWFELYEDDDLQLRRKWHLLDTHEDVLATCTGSESAQAELLGSMVEHLCHHHPDRYRRCSVRGRPHLRLPSLRCLLAVDGRDEPPIATAARLVSDDLCLMRADGEHAHTLVAAAVCFPTRWSLRAKMGSSMAAIHAPVPGYQARIGTASDRLMSAVGTQRPLERENWSVLDDAALYQPSRGNVRVAGSAARRAGPGSLWFRSERQTLRRLATSGDVLFGIRIRQRPLDELCKDPRFRRTLREQIASMSPEMRRYKGLEFNLKSLLDLLEDD